MTTPLELVLDEAAHYTPSAWFLPGAEVGHWLEELAHSGLAEVDTRLFAVPRVAHNSSSSSFSSSIPEIAGLLVIPSHASRITHLGSSPSGLPCRSLLDRI